jgi:dTDP-4-amino-4,6-dideoxygalactose transaminase
MNNVPFVDLSHQNAIVKDEIFQAWSQLVENADFVLGQNVWQFEKEFAEFCGLAECVAVGNGGDAVEFALRVLGVASGDEVIIPANTFIATATAIERIGAIPVLVDVDIATQLIDPEEVEPKINDRTKAVVAVHLFGQMAPMRQLSSICKKHGVSLIEDAAQAQGALQDGLGLGFYSDVVATSFYPGKNLGAYGDAGAILTNDKEIAQRLFEMRNYGGTVKYVHPTMGYNSRLDNLQASVLSAKLVHLNKWNEQRNEIATAYKERLVNLQDIVLPKVDTSNFHVWHLFVIQLSNREKMMQHLTDNDVGFGIHYPTPIHLHGAFSYLGKKVGDFPIAEHLSNAILSLPMYPGMKVDQIDYVSETIKSCPGLN